MKLRLWRKYNFQPGDRVVTWSPEFDGYRGTLIRKSRLPWSWVVEFDSDHVPGGKRRLMPQANLIPERLAPERGIDDLFDRPLRSGQGVPDGAEQKRSVASYFQEYLHSVRIAFTRGSDPGLAVTWQFALISIAGVLAALIAAAQIFSGDGVVASALAAIGALFLALVTGAYVIYSVRRRYQPGEDDTTPRP